MGRGLSQGLSHTQRPELQTPLREQSLWQAASPAASAAAPRRSASIASAAAADARATRPAPKIPIPESPPFVIETTPVFQHYGVL